MAQNMLDWVNLEFMMATPRHKYRLIGIIFEQILGCVLGLPIKWIYLHLADRSI